MTMTTIDDATRARQEEDRCICCGKPRTDSTSYFCEACKAQSQIKK